MSVEAMLVTLDGSAPSLGSLGVATWLAGRLDVPLHALTVEEGTGGGETLEGLGVPEKHRHAIELHRARGTPSRAILEAIGGLGIGLLVMAAGGETAAATSGAAPGLVGHVTREVIERSGTPVLVLPRDYEEHLPWRSILVALSGEAPDTPVLTFVLGLARDLDLRVRIAHVVTSGKQHADATQPSYADESHHEIAARLNQLVAAACATCGAEEKRRIASFDLVRGDIGRELLRLAHGEPGTALAIGWRGQLMQGHAEIVKAVLRQVRCPVLFVKASPKVPVLLKVGERLAT